MGWGQEDPLPCAPGVAPGFVSLSTEIPLSL